MVPERQAVERATARLRSIRFVGMEHFGARDGTTRQVSLDEVDRCQVYVGVIGPRWGSGITEAEYRRAQARGLPCLLYFKGGVVPDDERLVAIPGPLHRDAERRQQRGEELAAVPARDHDARATTGRCAVRCARPRFSVQIPAARP